MQQDIKPEIKKTVKRRLSNEKPVVAPEVHVASKFDAYLVA